MLYAAFSIFSNDVNLESHELYWQRYKDIAYTPGIESSIWDIHYRQLLQQTTECLFGLRREVSFLLINGFHLR